VSIGVIFLIIVAIKVIRGDLDNEKPGFMTGRKGNYEIVETMGLYWHFVDLCGYSSSRFSISGEKTNMAHAEGQHHAAAHHPTAAGEHHVEGQQHPLGIYFKIWGLLFVLSTLSYLVDYSTSRATSGGR
jgi:hypothetical protein